MRGVVVAVAASLLLPASSSGELFRDAAERWNILFRHHHGGSGERYMVETMVGGVVVFDYDRDGDPDLFFVDGGSLPGYSGEPARSRLLRNDGGRFTDVTDASGITVTGYGSGAVAGDVDGDGDDDLYVTAFGSNQLLRNRGDGTFEEATEDSGLGDPAWSASAAFADTDRDGDLDLYVTNYLQFELAKHRTCRDANNDAPIYCPPSTYPGAADRFYRNRGDGTFEDATGEVGLVPSENMAGLGVVFGDVDRDGWTDVYVANDEEPNLLFLNLGEGRFEEQGLLSGTAVSERGEVEAGMGVDLGDVDGDGLPDIVVTNFEKESNSLYRNLGGGVFVDHRYPSNVAESSLLMLAFGVALVDVDHDADLDLVIGNGHVRDNADMFGDSPYRQRNQVLLNDGRGRFAEVDAAETGFEHERVTRGLAYGDLDGDGDMDLVTVSSNDLSEAYENVAGASRGGWLLLDTVGREGNPRALGTVAELVVGGRRQHREVRSAASYLSQNAATLHFGTGDAERAEALDLRWPDGRRQRLVDPPLRRRLVVRGAR